MRHSRAATRYITGPLLFRSRSPFDSSFVPNHRPNLHEQQTDVSRLQALELKIQERVAAELRRLREQEAEALREAQRKLSAEPSAAAEHPQGDNHQQQQQQQYSGPSRQEVSKAAEDLGARLEERRKVRRLPDSVERARSEVVRCLRENDRRPLDCWREVEAFKEEVRKLEKGWVDKVVS